MTAPRRHLEVRPVGCGVACILCWVLGIAIGLGGSIWWPWGPWGFAPPPPAEAPEVAPAPGQVLHDAVSSALVLSGTVGDLADGSRVAVVAWIRGKTGREAVRVLGCQAGAGTLAPLDDPARRERWRATGAGIFDLVARAVCVGADSSNHPKGTT